MEYLYLLRRLHLFRRRKRFWKCMANPVESIESFHLRRPVRNPVMEAVEVEMATAMVMEIGLFLVNRSAEEDLDLDLLDHPDLADRPDPLDLQVDQAELEREEKEEEMDSEQSFYVRVPSSPPTRTGNPTSDGGSSWAIGYGK